MANKSGFTFKYKTKTCAGNVIVAPEISFGGNVRLSLLRCSDVRFWKRPEALEAAIVSNVI